MSTYDCPDDDWPDSWFEKTLTPSARDELHLYRVTIVSSTGHRICRKVRATDPDDAMHLITGVDHFPSQGDRVIGCRKPET